MELCEGAEARWTCSVRLLSCRNEASCRDQRIKVSNGCSSAKAFGQRLSTRRESMQRMLLQNRSAGSVDVTQAWLNKLPRLRSSGGSFSVMGGSSSEEDGSIGPAALTGVRGEPASENRIERRARHAAGEI